MPIWLMRKKPLTPDEAAARMLEPDEKLIWFGKPDSEWWLVPSHLALFLIPGLFFIYFTFAEFFEWSFHLPIMGYVTLFFVTIIAFNAVLAAKKLTVYAITDRRILIRRNPDKYDFAVWANVRGIRFVPVRDDRGYVLFDIEQDGRRSTMRFKAVGPLSELEELFKPFIG